MNYTEVQSSKSKRKRGHQKDQKRKLQEEQEQSMKKFKVVNSNGVQKSVGNNKFIRSMMQMFPDAGEEMIRSIFEDNNN